MLDQFVNIVYGGHLLEITSMVGTYSLTSPLYDHPTLFTSVCGSRSLSKPITFITRLPLDAALYEPAPPRRPGQMGRPRLKGERLPNLSVVAIDSSTAWRSITVADWYGKAENVRWRRPPQRRCGTARDCPPCP